MNPALSRRRKVPVNEGQNFLEMFCLVNHYINDLKYIFNSLKLSEQVQFLKKHRNEADKFDHENWKNFMAWCKEEQYKLSRSI